MTGHRQRRLRLVGVVAVLLLLNQLLLELKVRSDAHPEANTWGYYTKDEIRRLVALGDRYHVDIIPEINSPGHKRGRAGTGGRVERHPGQGGQWWPAECDVSIRDGWFYHADQRPKSVDELTSIYLGSVGRNAVLLLNVPPDTEGLLHVTDVVRLREFRERIERELPEDLARGTTVTGSPGVRTVDLGAAHEVDRIRLAEDIRHGQQVENFVVEAYRDGVWAEVTRAGTIGASRILPLTSPVRARRWRLRVTGARDTVRIAEFGLYRSRL